MFRFIDFKGFAEAELDLDRTPVTVLVGRNGSGKSNAIEGVALLGALARGVELNEITDLGEGGRHELRGGLEDAIRFGQTSFSLGADLSDGRRYHLTVTHRVSDGLLQDGAPVVDSRIRQPAAVTFWEEELHQGGVQVASTKNRQANAHTVRAGLPVVIVVDPVPSLMRSPEPLRVVPLARTGKNLSAVLYCLKVGSEEDQATLARLVSLLCDLPEEPFDAIEFDEMRTPEGLVTDVRLRFVSNKGTQVDARLLSDGTLRALAILTALETAPEGTIVVVEELDNAIHPSRIKRLLKASWETAERRKLKVLVTTHDTALLDAMTPEQMEGVVLCWWDGETRASRMVRLSDLPDPDLVAEPDQLGSNLMREIHRSQLARDYLEQKREGTLARLRALENDETEAEMTP